MEITYYYIQIFMDIPLKKMFSCMVHNLQLWMINITNLVYFPELLIKKLTCLDTIHVYLKQFNKKDPQPERYF